MCGYRKFHSRDVIRELAVRDHLPVLHREIKKIADVP
jgi:hypothetical protein